METEGRSPSIESMPTRRAGLLQSHTRLVQGVAKNLQRNYFRNSFSRRRHGGEGLICKRPSEPWLTGVVGWGVCSLGSYSGGYSWLDLLIQVRPSRGGGGLGGLDARDLRWYGSARKKASRPHPFIAGGMCPSGKRAKDDFAAAMAGRGWGGDRFLADSGGE